MTYKTKIKLSEIIASLFILLFFYTGISKFIDHKSFQFVLSKSPLIENQASLIAWALPTIELIVSVLLFMKKTQLVGFYMSLVLMLLFTAYITYMLLFIPKLPCSCGGILKSLTWKEHLAFNLSFTFLALLAILLSKDQFLGKDLNKILIT